MFDKMHRPDSLDLRAPTHAERWRAPLRRPVVARGPSIERQVEASSGPDRSVEYAGPPAGGAPLSAELRRELAPRLGHDLGDVRVHTGPEAARAADAVDAQAFTVGRDIHFAAGKFAPHTGEGRGLLVHELVHTIQQRNAGPAAGRLDVSAPHDAAEREADAVAHGVADSSPVAAPPAPTISRAPGAMLSRVPIGGNAFGTWDFRQTSSSAQPGDGWTFDAWITFAPVKTGAVKATQIGFVQALKHTEQGTGRNLNPLPNMKNRRTKDLWAIDRVNLNKHGWYGTKDDAAGTPMSSNSWTPGSAPTNYSPASMHDKVSNIDMNCTVEFETATIARAGADAGKVYGTVSWGFDVDGSNKVTPRKVVLNAASGKSFNEAVDKWNEQAKGPAEKKNAPDQQPLGPFK